MNKNAAHAVDVIGLGLVRVTALVIADCLSLTRGARGLEQVPGTLQLRDYFGLSRNQIRGEWRFVPLR